MEFVLIVFLSALIAFCFMYVIIHIQDKKKLKKSYVAPSAVKRSNFKPAEKKPKHLNRSTFGKINVDDVIYLTRIEHLYTVIRKTDKNIFFKRVGSPDTCIFSFNVNQLKFKEHEN